MKQQSNRIQDATVGVALVGGIAIGLLLFVFLPNLIAEQLTRFHVTNDWRLKNLATETIKIVFVLSYIWAIGRLPEIKRVFMYHGAEHKAINTLEADQDLTIPNCLQQTRLHPRCGTSFAIVVLIVSLFLFTFVPRYPIHSLEGQIFVSTLVRVALELCVLPIVAGISYELIRLAGKFRNSSLIKALFWPGLMTQYLTTSEPDSSQVEVALAALRAVVEAEQGTDVPATQAEASAIA